MAISQLVTDEIAMTRRMNVLALQAERAQSKGAFSKKYLRNR
jgi:hypothetical protein